jgi:adenosylhomocysteine nucleosidase
VGIGALSQPDGEQFPPRGLRLVSVIAVVGLSREASIVGTVAVPVIAGGRVDIVRRRIEKEIPGSISGVISIGIAGALSPNLHVGDCVIAREIVVGGKRFKTDTTWADGLAGRLAEAKSGAIAGVLQPAANKAAKAALHLATGADAVDMESGIAAEVAASRGLPFAALRVISDDAFDSLPHAALVAMKDGGGIDLGAVMRSLLSRPAQISRLIGTARDAERAFRVLLRCRNLLGVGLGCPYLG